MSAHMKIKKNDLVLVVAGNGRGKRGKVLKVFPDKKRVIIEGVNIVKKHQKPTQSQPQGGIVSREGSIHVSNVMLLDAKTGQPTRIGRRVLTGAEKAIRVRYSKVSNEDIHDVR